MAISKRNREQINFDLLPVSFLVVYFESRVMFYRRIKRNAHPKPILRSLWISLHEILRSRLSDVWTPCVVMLLCCLTPYLWPFPLRLVYYLSRCSLCTEQRSPQWLPKKRLRVPLQRDSVSFFWELLGALLLLYLKITRDQ